MGNCIHCKTEISLKEGEKNCPNCSMPPYICWECHNQITGEQKQCNVCGFFICFNCGVCGMECKFGEHLKAIKNKSKRDIVEYFFDLKLGFIRKNCPKGVPISYAKSKLRNAALKLKGFHVRNIEDRDAFKERFQNVLFNWPIGKTWTINKEREDGFYGSELREISNLGVCMGRVKKHIETNQKTKQQYDLFEKVEEERCQYVNWENLILKQCHKCEKNYKITELFCNECIYERGDKKGLAYDLKERKSSVDFCQLSRKDFNKKEVLKKDD